MAHFDNTVVGARVEASTDGDLSNERLKNQKKELDGTQKQRAPAGADSFGNDLTSEQFKSQEKALNGARKEVARIESELGRCGVWDDWFGTVDGLQKELAAERSLIKKLTKAGSEGTLLKKADQLVHQEELKASGEILGSAAKWANRTADSAEAVRDGSITVVAGVATCSAGPAGGAAVRFGLGSACNAAENISGYLGGEYSAEQAIANAKQKVLGDAVGAASMLVGGAVGSKVFGKVSGQTVSWSQAVLGKLAGEGTKQVASGVVATGTRFFVGNQISNFVSTTISNSAEASQILASGGEINRTTLKHFGMNYVSSAIASAVGFKAGIMSSSASSLSQKALTFGIDSTANAAVALSQTYLENGRLELRDYVASGTQMVNQYAQAHVRGQFVSQKPVNMVTADRENTHKPIRTSTNGEVEYVSDPQKVKEMFVQSRTRELFENPGQLKDGLAPADQARHESQSVGAFFDRSRGVMVVPELSPNATPEQRVIYGGLLAHEDSHSNQQTPTSPEQHRANEIEAYARMDGYLNRNGYELDLSSGGLAIHKVPEGQTAVAKSPEQIADFVDLHNPVENSAHLAASMEFGRGEPGEDRTLREIRKREADARSPEVSAKAGLGADDVDEPVKSKTLDARPIGTLEQRLIGEGSKTKEDGVPKQAPKSPQIPVSTDGATQPNAGVSILSKPLSRSEYFVPGAEPAAQYSVDKGLVVCNEKMADTLRFAGLVIPEGSSSVVNIKPQQVAQVLSAVQDRMKGSTATAAEIKGLKDIARVLEQNRDKGIRIVSVDTKEFGRDSYGLSQRLDIEIQKYIPKSPSSDKVLDSQKEDSKIASRRDLQTSNLSSPLETIKVLEFALNQIREIGGTYLATFKAAIHDNDRMLRVAKLSGTRAENITADIGHVFGSTATASKAYTDFYTHLSASVQTGQISPLVAKVALHSLTREPDPLSYNALAKRVGTKTGNHDLTDNDAKVIAEVHGITTKDYEMYGKRPNSSLDPRLDGSHRLYLFVTPTEEISAKQIWDKWCGAVNASGLKSDDLSFKKYCSGRCDGIPVYVYNDTPVDKLNVALDLFSSSLPSSAKAPLGLSPITKDFNFVGTAPEPSKINRLLASIGSGSNFSYTSLIAFTLEEAAGLAVYEKSKKTGVDPKRVGVTKDEVAPYFKELLKAFYIDAM